METIAHDKRELIKTKNGYFKYTLCGSYTTGAVIGDGHDCKFSFHLPPLNEMGFSDQYNQCLVQIRSITLVSSAITANGNFGENAVWFTGAGGLTAETGGIQLVSNIPCRNQVHLATTGATWTHNDSVFAQTLSQKLSNKTETLYSVNTTTVDTLDFLGTHENLLMGDKVSTTAGSRYQVNSRNVWSYETDKDIWTGGMLCGIPMGTDVQFQIKSLYDGDNLCLSSANTHLEGTGTVLNCELEIQLLPNPTPTRN